MSRSGFIALAGALGLVAGVILAFVPAGDPFAPSGLPRGAVAVVNGTVITELDLARVVAAQNAGSTSPTTPDERGRILQTLIHEELLVQQAMALDLPHSDREIRAAAIRSVLQVATAGIAAAPATEVELRAFYEGNPQLLKSADRLLLRHLVLQSVSADRSSDVAEQLIAGMAFEDVAARSEDVALGVLPNTPIREPDLVQYLGQTLLGVAAGLQPGEIAGPITIGNETHFIWLVAREEGQRPAFADAHDAIEAEWRRQRENAAVEAYVRDLEAQADIVVLP